MRIINMVCSCSNNSKYQNSTKIQILEKKTQCATHLLKLVDKMCTDEMDPSVEKLSRFIRHLSDGLYIFYSNMWNLSSDIWVQLLKIFDVSDVFGLHWDPVSIAEDADWTWFHSQMDGQMDRWMDKVKPVYPLSILFKLGAICGKFIMYASQKTIWCTI